MTSRYMVLVSGYLGFGNLGDEAILAGMLHDLRAVCPELDFVVVSGDPQRTQALHGERAVLWTDVPAIVDAARRSDLLLSAGGLFQDYWGLQPETMLTRRHGGISFYGAFPVLADLLGKPCMLYAIGVGPLSTPTAQQYTRAAFELSHCATVRDPESLALLQEIGVTVSERPGVEVTADPAFSLPAAGRQAVDSALRQAGVNSDVLLYGVSLRYWDLDVKQGWELELARALDSFLDRNPGQPVFLPFQQEQHSRYDDDAAVIRRVLAALKHRERAILLDQPVKPEVMAGILARCDLVLAMRFHAVLFALNAAVPVVNLAYDPKTTALMRRAGLEHLSLNASEWQREAIAGRMAEAQSGDLKTQLTGFAEEMRSLARRNAALAVELLESGVPARRLSGDRLIRDFALEKAMRVVALEDQIAREEQAVGALRNQIEEQARAIELLQAQLVERDRAAAARRDQPDRVTGGTPGRWGWLAGRVRALMAPPASRRTHLLRAGLRRTSGLRAALARMVRPPSENDRRREGSFAHKPTDSGTFLILSGVPIDDTGGGARCTQMALELLRQGFAVVFVNKFPRQETVDLGLRIEHPNLFTSSFSEFDLAAFRQAHSRLFATDLLTAIVQLPAGDCIPLIRDIRGHGGVVVYDLIDDWSTSLGGDWYSPQVEQEIIGLSHCLVATAPVLVDRLRSISGQPVAHLPNAVNLRLFDPNKSYVRPADLPDSEWIAMYIGALWGEWFDWDLLLKTAEQHPQAAVVVIGDYRGQCPEPPANLHFLGLKPQSALPAYLAHADVAMIPWKVGAVTQAASPLKVYEYLAMGVPVVAPNLSPQADMPGVLLAHDIDGFVEQVGEFRLTDPLRDQVRQFVADHTWEARVGRLIEIVREGFREAQSATPPELLRQPAIPKPESAHRPRVESEI